MLARHPQQLGAEIEAVRGAVALDGDAALGRQRDQLLPARRDRIAVSEVPAGRVAPDAALRVHQGAADAVGLAWLVELEALVHGADHHLELVQDVRRPVEGAILEDVHLAAAQDADLGDLLLHQGDLVPLAPQPVHVQPVRVVRRAGVIGDGDELRPQRVGGADHLLQGGPPVGPGGVAMHESADVALLDQLGQRALRGQLQLAQVLAQLGRDGLQPEQAVQCLFGFRLQRRSAVEAGEPVLGDAEALVPRDPAQLDVVLLASGEVVQRGGELRHAHHPQVRLQPVAQAH